jgi:DNA-binding CsgD family transcriptional regulator
MTWTNSEKKAFLRDVENGSAFGFEFYQADIERMAGYFLAKLYPGRQNNALRDYGYEIGAAWVMAKKNYRPNKYQFKHYLMTAIRWFILKRYQADKKVARLNVSYSHQFEDYDKFLDRQPGKTTSDTELKSIVWAKITPRQQKIVQMRMDGYLQREIALEVGFNSHQQVNHELRRVRKKVSPILKRAGVII